MIEINKLYNEDCIAFMDKADANLVNILYTDVPYNLGSRYVIDKSTGHYRFKRKGTDFMNLWDAMDGLWWDRWFASAYRIIKEGGFLITHNIDRQSDLWTYYARRNGFMPIQKLYWMFIDSFPKGTDLGLKIDNKLNVEREVVNVRSGAQSQSTGRYGKWGNSSLMKGLRERSDYIKAERREYIKAKAKDVNMANHIYLKGKKSIYEETVATSDMAKKYDGYKYGQAPFKQILEEILVFWKEPEGDVPSQVILYEQRKKMKRPTLIHPSIINIRDTRVISRNTRQERWTPQLLIDDRLVPKLVKKFGHEDSFRLNEAIVNIPILDGDNWNYVKKATIEEKEWGLDNFVPKTVNSNKRKNTHPTPKPLALAKWVLKLFALPDKEEMIIYDPFCGQGTIPLAAKQLGMQWLGTELDTEYFRLADAKLTHIEVDKQETLF